MMTNADGSKEPVRVLDARYGILRMLRLSPQDKLSDVRFTLEDYSCLTECGIKDIALWYSEKRGVDDSEALKQFGVVVDKVLDKDMPL
jgi:hypothetical protein